MLFLLMIRRPPRSTRTDTLFPYTTLFRSARLHLFPEASQRPYENSRQEPEVKASTEIDRKRAPNVGRSGAAFSFADPWLLLANAAIGNSPRKFQPQRARHRRPRPACIGRRMPAAITRSDERRVGKECGSTVQTR